MSAENTPELTLKQRKFIDEYLIDFNGTQAAIRAGYSKNTAREIASENLTKPNIREELENRIKSAQLDAEATKKIISTIAKSNANKYLKVVKTEFTPRVEKHLSELIEELRAEIDFEGEYAVLADFGEGEFDEHVKMQNKRRNKILRYELELKRNPNATRVVYGKTEWIETTEFDLVSLAKDKEAGIIKSYKMTKDGPQVEFCSVDNQLANLARIHSLFKDKLDVTSDDKPIFTGFKTLIAQPNDTAED